MPRSPVNVGCDIGKINDPSAICVTEITRVSLGKFRSRGQVTLGHMDERGNWIPPQGIEEIMRSEYTVRHITRLPLEMSYPDVAIHIADMLDNPLFAERRVKVYIDVTGVGRPVYDTLLRVILERKAGVWDKNGTLQLQNNAVWHVQMRPISFVHGEAYNRTKGTVGKAFIVSKLQSHLQEGRFHAPDTPEVKAMLAELRNYAVTLNEHGNEQYGASSGHHDDLATAAALAVLVDPYSERITYSQRVY